MRWLMADRSPAVVAWLISLPLLACLGCSASPADGDGPAVTDSAGIRLVRHSDHEPERLAVSAQPELVLGARPDGSDALFRVRGGALLPDGSVAVVNSGSNEVLYFADDGELTRRVGGEGGGPGEFSNILWVKNEGGGAVSVYDAGNARITRLDARGAVAEERSVLMEGEPSADEGLMVGRGFLIGVTADFRILAVPWAAARLDGAEGPLPLVGELRRYESDLSTYAALDSVRLRTWYEVEQPEGPPIGQILEAPVFVFSANRAWTAYSEADAYRTTVLEEGEISYRIDELRPRVAFAPDSVPTYYAEVADSLPTYRTVQVDSDGRIWLGSPTESSDVAEWRVFSDRGESVRALELPASASVLDARGDRVLLLERDELDVETVTIRTVGIPLSDADLLSGVT